MIWRQEKCFFQENNTESIINLGVEYGLTSKYTSYVAIEDRNESTIVTDTTDSSGLSAGSGYLGFSSSYGGSVYPGPGVYSSSGISYYYSSTGASSGGPLYSPAGGYRPNTSPKMVISLFFLALLMIVFV